jgi:hypothetical protein
MNQSKLPADSLSLILGIIALVIIVGGCCCYGFPAFVGLILSIIGLISANKSLAEYDVNPEIYSHQSRSNVATAKIINIIAVILSSIISLIMIGFLILYGSILSFGMFNNSNFNNWDEEQNDYEYDYEEEQIIEEELFIEENDSIYYEEALHIEQRI